MAEMLADMDIEQVFKRNVKRVWRVCYSFLGNAADAEDATQATFLRLIDHPQNFEDEQHEKAWLIVCASNLCRDMLKSSARTKVDELIGEHELVDTRAQHVTASLEAEELLKHVLALPDIYKDVVYLYYYEGFTTGYIAQMLDVPASTVRNRLADARARLKRGIEGVK
ncbi:MAG: RNA polymerase sigma factor [Atopobiaceae bacterium]|nr:RNA polymerase sigma factor [Atopobiaceae bacterium]